MSDNVVFIDKKLNSIITSLIVLASPFLIMSTIENYLFLKQNRKDTTFY